LHQYYFFSRKYCITALLSYWHSLSHGTPSPSPSKRVTPHTVR
jgi:hypothetical protein